MIEEITAKVRVMEIRGAQIMLPDGGIIETIDHDVEVRLFTVSVGRELVPDDTHLTLIVDRHLIALMVRWTLAQDQDGQMLVLDNCRREGCMCRLMKPVAIELLSAEEGLTIDRETWGNSS